MKKFLYIIIAIVAVAVMGSLVFALFGRKSPPSTPPSGGGLPPSVVSTSTVSVPSGDTIVIGTPRGSVTVKSPYKSPVEVNVENDVVIKRTENYELDYFAKDNSFLIDVLVTPFEAARKEAESNFLSALGITQDQACKLSVFEAVPFFVDPNLAGRSYSLSFCPNAIK